eukprot:6118622-Pleurochrysis_carterae.AAC.1
MPTSTDGLHRNARGCPKGTESSSSARCRQGELLRAEGPATFGRIETAASLQCLVMKQFSRNPQQDQHLATQLML